jgi:hypothetical protein
MQPLSFYHGIYFPRRLEERFRQGVFFDGCGVAAIARWRRRHVLFLEKLALLQPGRRLLIKNPVYSARISMLREIWPEAKFIHIYRNPYRVQRAPSTPGCCRSSRCSGSSVGASTS